MKKTSHSKKPVSCPHVFCMFSGAIVGSAALGYETGQLMTGIDTEVLGGLECRVMGEDERMERIGTATVGWANMAAGLKIKNIKIDKPHGKLGPHIQYGPAHENSINYNPFSGKFQPFGHPQKHFGPVAPGGGKRSGGWGDWLSGGGGWTNQ